MIQQPDDDPAEALRRVRAARQQATAQPAPAGGDDDPQAVLDSVRARRAQRANLHTDTDLPAPVRALERAGGFLQHLFQKATDDGVSGRFAPIPGYEKPTVPEGGVYNAERPAELAPVFVKGGRATAGQYGDLKSDIFTTMDRGLGPIPKRFTEKPQTDEDYRQTVADLTKRIADPATAAEDRSRFTAILNNYELQNRLQRSTGIGDGTYLGAAKAVARQGANSFLLGALNKQARSRIEDAAREGQIVTPDILRAEGVYPKEGKVPETLANTRDEEFAGSLIGTLPYFMAGGAAERAILGRVAAKSPMLAELGNVLGETRLGQNVIHASSGMLPLTVHSVGTAAVEGRDLKQAAKDAILSQPMMGMEFGLAGDFLHGRLGFRGSEPGPALHPVDFSKPYVQSEQLRARDEAAKAGSSMVHELASLLNEHRQKLVGAAGAGAAAYQLTKPADERNATAPLMAAGLVAVPGGRGEEGADPARLPGTGLYSRMIRSLGGMQRKVGTAAEWTAELGSLQKSGRFSQLELDKTLAPVLQRIAAEEPGRKISRDELTQMAADTRLPITTTKLNEVENPLGPGYKASPIMQGDPIYYRTEAQRDQHIDLVRESIDLKNKMGELDDKYALWQAGEGPALTKKEQMKLQELDLDLEDLLKREDEHIRSYGIHAHDFESGREVFEPPREETRHEGDQRHPGNPASKYRETLMQYDAGSPHTLNEQTLQRTTLRNKMLDLHQRAVAESAGTKNWGTWDERMNNENEAQAQGLFLTSLDTRDFIQRAFKNPADRKAYRDAADAYERVSEDMRRDRDKYYGSHFAQPNILGHSRSDVREMTAEDGSTVKVRLGGEVQSDHSADYRKMKAMQDALAKVEVLDVRHKSPSRRKYTDDVPPGVPDRGYAITLDRATDPGYPDVYQVWQHGKLLGTTDTEAEARAWTDVGKVPEPPLKNVEHWSQPVVAQLLHDAASEGHEAVAFPSGEQSAKLAGLGAKFESLEFTHHAGKYDLRGVTPYGEEYNLGDVPDAKLEEHIGDGPAEILRQRVREHIHQNPGDTYLEGRLNEEELALKGEDKKFLYNKAIPKVLGNIFKQIGEKLKIESFDDGGFRRWGVRLTPELREKILKYGLPALGVAATASSIKEKDTQDAMTGDLKRAAGIFALGPALGKYGSGGKAEAKVTYTEAELNNLKALIKREVGHTVATYQNGEPKLFFHGTSRSYAAADLSKSLPGMFGVGYYLSDYSRKNPTADAQLYTAYTHEDHFRGYQAKLMPVPDELRPNVRPYYLRVRRPLRPGEPVQVDELKDLGRSIDLLAQKWGYKTYEEVMNASRAVMLKRYGPHHTSYEHATAEEVLKAIRAHDTAYFVDQVQMGENLLYLNPWMETKYGDIRQAGGDQFNIHVLKGAGFDGIHVSTGGRNPAAGSVYGNNEVFIVWDQKQLIPAFSPKNRGAVPAVLPPVIAGVGIALAAAQRAVLQMDDDTKAKYLRSAQLVGEGLAAAGLVALAGKLAINVGRRPVRPAFDMLVTRGAAAGGMIALGAILRQSDDPDIKNTGTGLIGLAAMHAVGSPNFAKVGAEMGKGLAGVLENTRVGRRLAEYFVNDVYMNPDQKALVKEYEGEIAKGRAVAQQFGRRAKALGPVADRATTDAVDQTNREPLAGTLDPKAQQAVLALATEYIDEVTRLGREQVQAGIYAPEQIADKEGRYIHRSYALFEVPRVFGNSMEVRGGTGAPRRQSVRPEASRRLTDSEGDINIRDQIGEVREFSYNAPHTIEKAYRNLAAAHMLEMARAIPGTIHPDFERVLDDHQNALRLLDQAKATGTPADVRAAQHMVDGALSDMRSLQTTYKADPNGDWLTLPDSKGLGPMAGVVVKRNMYREITGLAELKGLGNVMQKWKVVKTVYNLGTHVGNAVSNHFVMHMNGIPLHKQVQYVYGDALKDLRNYGPATKALNEAGVLDVNAVNAGAKGPVGSLTPSKANWQELLETTRPETVKAAAQFDNPLIRPTPDLQKLEAKTLGFAREKYQGHDNLARVALYQQAIREGRSPSDAVEFARNALGNFRTRSQALRDLRGTIAPFIMYTAKQIPTITATIIEHPWRYMQFVAAWGITNEMMQALQPGGGIAQRDLAPSQRRSAIGYMLPPMLEFPFAGSKGQKWGINLDRYTPFAALSTSAPPGTLGGAISDDLPAILQPGGPFADFFGKAVFNKNVLTDREATPRYYTPGEKAARMARLAFDEVTPSWLGFHGLRAADDILDSGNPAQAVYDFALGSTGTRPQTIWPGRYVMHARQQLLDDIRNIKRELVSGVIPAKTDAARKRHADRFQKRIRYVVNRFKDRVPGEPLPEDAQAAIKDLQNTY